MDSGYYENLSSIRRKALENNDKTEEDLGKDIEIIKEWFKTQPHLPEIASDKVITSFLMMNKFSIEKTKKRIDMYYTMRSMFPEFFDGTHPLSPRMKKVMNDTYFIPLPKATDEGCRVIILHMPNENIEDYSIEASFSVQFNAYEQRFQADYQVGDILIYDLHNTNMGIIGKLTPTFVRKISMIVEQTYNNRIKQIHLVNVPPFAKSVLTLAISFLNKKIANRVYLHQGIDSITNYVPANILPKDYGGEERSLQELDEMFKQELATHKERFDCLEKLRVNEKLRPIPLINDEILGFYGNFKKLNVD